MQFQVVEGSNPTSPRLRKKRIQEAVRKATGVTRVCEWRDGMPAGSLFVQFGRGFEVGAFRRVETMRR